MSRVVAVACVLGGLYVASARAEISQSESAREYAERLRVELEKVSAERDVAVRQPS